MNNPAFVFGNIEDVLQPGIPNLLQAAEEIRPGLLLSRIIKAAPPDGPATFVFVWNDVASADQIYIHFLDANGKMVYQADHPYKGTLRLQPTGTGEVLRIRAVEVPPDVARRVDRVGVGACTNSSDDGHGVILPAGSEP